jgi:hypothetical protein
VTASGEWAVSGYGARLDMRLGGGARPELRLVTLAPQCEYTMTVRSAEDAHALAELITAATVLGLAAGPLVLALRVASEVLPLEAEL